MMVLLLRRFLLLFKLHCTAQLLGLVRNGEVAV